VRRFRGKWQARATTAVSSEQRPRSELIIVAAIISCFLSPTLKFNATPILSFRFDQSVLLFLLASFKETWQKSDIRDVL
jgi:hypothetical protein